MKRVQQAWLRQSRTEYTAAALVAEMTHWLLVLGVNPDLLVRSSRVVRDELRHAAICRELYLHAGGPDEPVALSPQQLIHGDDRGAPLQQRAITAAGELACEESVALGVFRMRLENARDPVAQEVCTVILRDEATHRAFAWDLVDELIRMQGVEEVRRWARPRLGWWLRIYLRATLRPDEPTYPPGELAYGLIDRRQHWTAMRRTVEEDVLPRFRERGLLEEGVTGDDLKAELEAGAAG
ncbi:MAG TPA: ferritin-like domain-containing protein [Myxococcota bacterium]|nr:ferritin-like domain-containing protein [Myxococcota bacterium]